MDDMQDKYSNIEELLPRFCEGRTTEQESLLVEEWIAEDEAHADLVNQIHFLYLATDTLAVRKKINIEKALGKAERRITEKKISWWEWTQRIAAVLSIPLLISVFLMYAKLNTSQETAQMIEVKTNPGITTSVILPDSTVVYLNSESSLRYRSQFVGDTRDVELVGEAYFDVAKDSKKRFIISTSHQSQIEVYGTSFNVEAYANDNKVSTTLVEGKIGFLFKDKSGTNKKIDLSPNHKLIYDPLSGNIEMYATSCESETAWKDGKMVFNNTPMKDILRTLSKRYNVEFVVKNRNLEGYAFTGTFTTQRLEHIMEIFKISSRINWRYLDSDEITDKKQKIEIY